MQVRIFLKYLSDTWIKIIFIIYLPVQYLLYRGSIMLSRRILHSIVILFFIVSGIVVSAQSSKVAKAEAMFIYNFARLIQWPDEYRSGIFTIGVVGVSDVYTELGKYTTGKKVGFQDIEIKRFRNLEEINQCHILFIPFSRNISVADAAAKVSSYSTLIISERKDAIEQGAAINFLIEETRLQFELKEENATKYGLRISARLKDMASKSY